MRTGTTTDTYNLGLNRSYTLNYNLTDNMKSNYRKEPSKKNCRFCAFNQTDYCDVGVK